MLSVGEALITDLYELNMAASYLRRGMTEPATFSLFVRRLPPTRGFLVAAGLADCLRYLESLAFSDEDLRWLAGAGFAPDMIEALAALRFTGEVHAVEEGRVVFANEPLLEVTAPLPEAQLVETFLLNQVTFQSAVATKAARCQLAAGDMALVDFSLRRTQGAEAGLAAARLSAIAGFIGTSNVEAARRLDLVASGTMAHSYIEAFPSETEAFRAFAEDFPGRTTFLVDTYDTLGGVHSAIEVIKALALRDHLAVRLDSGDLVELARVTRQLLDAAGLDQVQIFVSGGLDEFDLEALRASGAPIDAAGVGTRMGVSADAPYLDSVYKLVQVGERPVLKLATGKATLPGAKQVWRRLPHGPDLLSGRHEAAPEGAEPLLVPVMAGGRRLGPEAEVAEARRRLREDLAALPADVLDLRQPAAPEPVVSDQLRMLTARLTAEHAPRQRPG
jgi:nicotinate phosphoribosyltransferase